VVTFRASAASAGFGPPGEGVPGFGLIPGLRAETGGRPCSFKAQGCIAGFR